MVIFLMTGLGISDYKNAIIGGAVGAALVALGILALIILAAFYVYHAMAWARIAKKMKFKYPWLAWIPFACGAMKLKLGKFHWAWIFLILIPILGWIALIVLLTIATWRIFEKERFPAWLSLSLPLIFVPKFMLLGFVVYFVSIGILAWKKKR